jgi:peptidoglycan-associated lipoprotein
MNNRLLHLCVPLALAFAAGCATQSPDNGSGTAASPGTPSSSATTSSGAPSSGMRGEPSSTRGGVVVRDAAGRPVNNSVYYEFDRSNLSAQDRKLVEAHAQYLREHPGVKVRVEGNADERGSKEYNLALGQRRAETVTHAMDLLGVGGDRVEAVSYGEEKPRATGHDEQAWAQNRRSDIVY